MMVVFFDVFLTGNLQGVAATFVGLCVFVGTQKSKRSQVIPVSFRCLIPLASISDGMSFKL